MIEADFPEIDIETTVTVYLKRFHDGKMPLPLEVEMCPVGFEREGWRAFARRILKEARARQH